MEHAGEGVVICLQALAELRIVGGGEPQAHAWTEIMVAGERVIEAVAFGPMTH